MIASNKTGSPRRERSGGPGVLPLVAIGIGAAVLGRVLRGTRRIGRPPFGRGGVALLAGAVAVALLRRRRRVREIQRLLAESGAPEETPGTQTQVPVGPADTPMGKAGRNAEQRLDEAVEETFPASDPIAVHIE